jgi:bisphosphoglycerate-dependent phosphoglycerate mutase
MDGIHEAREAGRLLKAHGFEFDVVYSSWLSRSIDTALYILDELDSLWLPMIKASLRRSTFCLLVQRTLTVLFTANS